MEENEKRRLENLKQLQEKMKKKTTRDSKLKQILIVFVSALIIALIVYLIMIYSGIINTTYSQFNKEFEIIYDAVKNQKEKKNTDPYYEYIGTKSSQRKHIYSNEYNDIEKIIGTSINEDFFVIDNSNAKGLGLEEQISGVYLINYDKLLVFNLKPYINDNEKTYILSNILEEYIKNREIDTSGANKPLLLEGMKPVKYNETLKKWEITTENDNSWYNYDDKKWANVILSDYEGEDIDQASMFVWIPRYAYKISENNYNTNKEGIIAIKFLKDNTNYDKEGNLINNKNTKSNLDYVVHPAFNFDKELTGIWVSKYEASSLEYGLTGENYGGDNNTKLTYKSVADRYSWVNVKIDTSYIISKNIIENSLYGLNKEQTDSHLMKNTEWGAVAYLAQSKYGRNNNQISINNYYEKEKLKTGYSTVNNNNEYGNAANITSLWNTENGVRASTTGNVYGIYDLVGGAIERTAAYLDNNSISLKNEALNLYQADNKYKDLYNVSDTDERSRNYSLAIKNYGDAVYETSSNGDENSSWYNGNSFMITGLYTFFYRGGSAIDGKKASLFYFSSSSGGVYKYAGFRAVLTEK